MEIILLSPVSIRIKGKKGAVVVNPTADIKAKVAGDAILLTSGRDNFAQHKVEGSRVTIHGVGEYEVAGIKITAHKSNSELVYQITIDGTQVLLGSVSAIERVKDKFQGADVALLYTDTVCDEAMLATLEPKVAVFFGARTNDIKTAMHHTGHSTTKYQTATTAETAVKEMELVWLM